MPFRPTRENLDRIRIYLQEGFEPLDIAERLHCDIRTVNNWRNRFEAGAENVVPAFDLRASKFTSFNFYTTKTLLTLPAITSIHLVIKFYSNKFTLFLHRKNKQQILLFCTS